MIGGSLLLFALRAPALAAGGLFAPVSREGALVLNNVLLCSIAAVVITGTMYPLFSDLLLGDKLSVGAPFFNATVLPLAVPVFVAMAIGPVLPWKRAALAPALLRIWWAAAFAAVVGLLVRDPAAGAAGAGLRRRGLDDRRRRGRDRRAHPPVPPAARRQPAAAARPAAAAFGAALAHAGMGVTVAGIAGMSLATSAWCWCTPASTVQAAGMTWTLDSLTDGDGSNYSERVANIRVIRPGQPDLVMHPSRRTFPVQKVTTTEAAIHTTGFADIYAVLGEERDGAAVMRLHYNPLAPWIWLGGLVMAMGGGLSLADRRLRVGAPARRTVPLAASPARDGQPAQCCSQRRWAWRCWAAARSGHAARHAAGDFDPRGVPSPITGQPVPAFDLPAQAPGQGFSSADLAQGRPVLLNFFASWCVPCVEEHPGAAGAGQGRAADLGHRLQGPGGQGGAVHPAPRRPVPAHRARPPGRVAIDFGLSGVPESFLVDGTGVVRWHWAGPLDADVIEHRLQPAWRALA